jgi:hypothetical protein
MTDHIRIPVFGVEGSQDYTIDNPPTLEQIMTRLHKLRGALHSEGIKPDRILLGSDLYLVLDLRVRERLIGVNTGTAGENLADTLYGMELICDPFLEPMDMRIIGRNQDNALRSGIIREANQEG